MNMSEFEKIIEDATGRIPERFKVILEKENIKLLAREKVPEMLQDKFLGDPVKAVESKLIFGIFIGVSYTNRSVFNIQQEPTRIELYKESFEKVFSNKSETPLKRWEDMKTQIIKTVVHEIGHYFGFSELKIRNIGY